MRQPSSSPRVPEPHSARKRRSAASRVFLSLFIIIILAGIAAGAAGFYGYQVYSLPGPLAANKIVDIEKGLRTPEIAQKLEAEGVISDARVFSAMAFATGIRGRLKAGEYEFAAGSSMSEVAALIMSGRSITYKLTIPEGWTSEMAVQRVIENPVLTGEIKVLPPEGSLMPDTYVFKRGMARQKLIDDMRAAQEKLLEDIWVQRNGLIAVKTKEEALILASIVEKETGTAAERPLVASVFMNRLKKGMRLQSDPTIIYGIAGGKGKLDRPLTKTDITTATPYNTYTISGLPPGPIANPGRAALEAVVNSPDTGYLYFVADGSGGHAFAATLDEHNRNVAKWRALAGGVVSATAETEPDPAPGPAVATPPAVADVPAIIPAPSAVPVPEGQTVELPLRTGGEAPAGPAAVQVAVEAPKPAASEATLPPEVKPAVAAEVEVTPPGDAAPVSALKPGSVLWVSGKLVPIPKRKPKR